MISIRDKDGNPFDGGKNYKLSVPPDAPVKQYWSVTAYDRETHAFPTEALFNKTWVLPDVVQARDMKGSGYEELPQQAP